MSEVKRYEYDKFTEQLEETENGDYVFYSEYENLKAQLERAEKALSAYGDMWIAREYFKEKELK